jgi:hypothetical protein
MFANVIAQGKPYSADGQKERVRVRTAEERLCVSSPPNVRDWFPLVYPVHSDKDVSTVVLYFATEQY